MTGHVFHPGHSELHGVTVVVEVDGGLCYVGRYHEETAAGLLLHDVAEHREDAGGTSRADFISKTMTFGVRVTRRHLTVPSDQVRRIVRLVEWQGAGGK